MVGREDLQQLHQRSDEAVVARGVENPYGPYFGGEAYFLHPPPIDPSRLTRFRLRLGASGAEWVGKATMDAGLDSGTVKPRAWRRVTVETTVPDQAVTLSTDRQRLNRSRVRLVRRCRPDEVGGRQRDARQGPPARR